MRKDIIIDVDSARFIQNKPTDIKNIGEIHQTSPENGMSENKAYFDVYIKDNDISDIRVELGYVPIDKNMAVRIHTKDGVIKNKRSGGYWFDVFFDNKQIKVCELPLISPEGVYALSISKQIGVANIYSGVEFDFKVDESIYQDAYLLMKLKKGKLFSAPLSGVGIQDSINQSDAEYSIRNSIINELNDDDIDPEVVDIYTDEQSRLMIDLKVTEK